MGIRFLCPNGHKLNVKSFLAGKKAVCPKCGEKVLVPTQNQLGASGPEPADEPEIGVGDPAPSQFAGTAVANAPVAAAPVVNTTASPAAVAAQPTIQSHAAQPQPVQPQYTQPQVSQPYAAAVDPIAEAPQAVWYVRPPSGGQFGPAAADVMRGWMGEGRVTADTLVWRSDWPDWKSAAAVFPHLAAPMPSVVMPQVAMSPSVMPPMTAPMMNGPMMGAPVQMMPAPVSPMIIGQSPMMAPTMPAGVPMGQVLGAPSYIEPSTADYNDPLARTRKRRQKGADATMIVSGILVALVVLLFIVLGVVLSQNSEEPAPERSKPKLKTAASKVEKAKKSVEKPADVEPLEREAPDMKPEFDDKELELPPLPGE